MQELVDRMADEGVSLSKAAISKYEKGQAVPRASVLLGLSHALGCSTEYLLTNTAKDIQWLRFRKRLRLKKRVELEVKEAAREWLEARLLVDEFVGREGRSFQLPSSGIADVADSERVAEKVRHIWDLGAWPIESLSLVIEKSGVIVIEIEADSDLDGLSGVAEGDIRFVVVAAGAPVDRMRMNLAHELGHVVIEPSENESFDEAAAFRFGAALLIPRSVVIDRIGKRRRTIDLRELILLKEEYGISVQALIHRCYDLDIISQWTYRQLNIEMRKRRWHKDEPGDCSQLERPTQFRSDLLRSISEGILSEGELRAMYPDVAGKMLPLESEAEWKWSNLRAMPKRERDEALRRAAEQSVPEYAEGGSLADLELVDDDE
jgi:Zn-dependent peptidase ImmA (M78 family)